MPGNPDDIEPIKFADRNTDLNRFGGNIRPILQGMLHNRRISGPDDDEADYVTGSLKYTRRKIPRRSLTPLSEFPDADVERAKRILKIFNIPGEEALDFQLESWDEIYRLDEEKNEMDEHRGAVLSAPTGFGKTLAFMGPIYDKILHDDEFTSAIIVYPRTALLRDQLSRILKRLHHVKQSDEFDSSFSVGTWMSGLPWDRSQVTNPSKTGVGVDDQGRTVFTLANYWDDDSDSDDLYISPNGNGYEIFNDDVSFDETDFVFPKSDIKDRSKTPDILLTTLESLELFGLKPNYSIINWADAIVFDEVHQYNGLRGSHAANIISNIKEVRNNPLLFLGSSATVANPEAFGRKLFNLPQDNQFVSIEPSDKDYDKDSEDYLHYYFLLSPEDGPGAASMYIQQMMLMGHSMIDPKQHGEPGELAKILSFIDSKSQIHQREQQFIDADVNDRLWQYHDSRNGAYVGNDQSDDYRRVAAETGHEFIEREIDIDPFHAESDTSISDLGRMELIQSTSSLEVGIDIDDIEIVSQYREPLGGLSSFVQRAGRAGREKDREAHMVTFLSSYAGDTNFYYRADRFLQSDIVTPLRTDNQVIEELHGMSMSFYEVMDEIYKEDRRNWHRSSYERRFLEDLFDEKLGLTAFHQFLVNTDQTVYSLVRLDTDASTLLDSSSIAALREDLSDELEDLAEEIEEIENLEGIDLDTTLRGDDPVNGIIDELRDASLNILAKHQAALSTVDESEVTGDALDEANELLEDVVGSIRSETSREPEERLEVYQDVARKLLRAASYISEIEGGLPDTNTIQDLIQGVTKTKQAVEEGILSAQRDKRKMLYYLERALNEIEEYVTADTHAPHGSLYFVKNLFRAAFFFDQCLRIDQDQEEDGLFYYPPDYFGNAGHSFTLSSENRHERDKVKPIDLIISQYAPFKSEYLSRTGEMQVFVPRMVHDGDSVRMDFSNVPGHIESGIKIPESLELTAVQDITGQRSQGILVHDPLTFDLFENEDTVPPRVDPERSRIHSEPHVNTRMEHSEEPESFGNLSLSAVEASAAIEAVTLEVSETYWHEEENEWRLTGDTEYEHIESSEPPLGFVLDTRGVSWNLEEFVESIEDWSDEVEQYKHLDEIDMSLEEIGLNTAAHFLTLLISDISGVNSEQLLQGISQGDEKKVFVFEQTEGGQGIVDLFFDTLRSRPDKVLRSMARILYNSQIMNEMLWANTDFVEELQDHNPHSEVDRMDFAGQYLDIPFENVRQRVSEEILSTVDRIEDIVEESGVDEGEVYDLKHRIAAERVAGHEEIPESVYRDFQGLMEEVSQNYIEDLLRSPDIDGCEANLHLTTTLFDEDQSDTLSYVLLEALRDDFVLDRAPKEDDVDEIMGREELWGGETDDEVIFISF